MRSLHLLHAFPRSLAILALTLGSWSVAASASVGVLFQASHYSMVGIPLPLPLNGLTTPITGMGVANVDDMVAAPRPFVLPPNAIAGTAMATIVFPQPTNYPFYTTQTSGTFGFQGGTFGPGLGPGPGKVWCPGHFGAGMGGSCPAATPSAGTKPGLIRYTGGGGFGGTAGILGTITSHPVIRSGAGFITGTLAQPLNAFGGPPGGTAVGLGILQHTTQGWTSPNSNAIVGAPWTTGTVIVSDAAGGVSSLQTYSGADNRNLAGTMGSVRLVAPSLSQYTSPSYVTSNTIVSFLNVSFLPEPRPTLMLSAGLLTLAALYRLAKAMAVA